MPAATRIGDADVSHCSGMTRAEGSPNVFVNKIPWSREGDNNTTHLLPAGPICVPHAAPIAAGSPTVRLNSGGKKHGHGAAQGIPTTLQIEMDDEPAWNFDTNHKKMNSWEVDAGDGGKGGGRVGDAIAGCTSVAAGSPDVFAGPGGEGVAPAPSMTLSFKETTV